MNTQAIPYIIPLLFSGTIPVILALYIRRKEHSPKVQMFTLLMIAVSIWSFGYSLELWSGELSAILFWKKMKYLGIVVVPVAWFTFCLHYTGKEKWITTRNLLLLFVIPVFNLILLWSNQFHNLFYEYVSLNSTGPFITAYASKGVGFWCNAAYSYILLFAGTFLLIIKSLSLSRLYLKQSIALLFGAITPLVGNALYITGLSPIPIDYDLTPLFFVVTGMALIYSVFRFRFLDLVPIARDTIIENISDVLLVFDKQNRIVDFNQIAKNIILEDAIHHPSESMMGKTVEEVFSKIPNLLNKFQDNVYRQTEIEIETKKMKRYYDARISPLYDKHEQIIGHVMILRDITERKKAYDTLQESEKRFQDVALSSADWIWEVDKDGRYTFASGKVKEILGYEPSEIIGKTPFDLMPDEEAKHVGEIFKEIASEKKSIVDLENWNLTKQGEKVCLLTNGISLLGENGELMGYCGVDKDITERKKAEETLNESRETFRSIFDSANDAIFLHDMKTGRILNVNKKMCETYDYTFDEALKSSIEDVSSGEKPYTQKEAGEWVKKAVKEPQLFEWHAKDKKGKLFWVEVNLKKVSVLGQDQIMAVVRDISERKKTIEELNQRIDELELFNEVTVDRELKMIELKKEINELCEKYGEKPKYTTD